MRGYKKYGNFNTPLDLAIENEIDRFGLAIDINDRLSYLDVSGAHVQEGLRDMRVVCRNHAHRREVGLLEAHAWVWST